ncbi:MAG TPA: matrixin family metalloprotease, partial [Chthoniobacterales bacterium]|nr:matrixin family metalloprotease [Chthoniobacterales bacterium]
MNSKFLIPLAVVIAAVSARAYVRETDSDNNLPVAWNANRTVLMHLSLPQTGGPFIDGFATFNASAEDALNIWNQYLAHMKFAVDRNSILPAADGDGNISVTMASTFYGMRFGSGVLAVTLVESRNAVLLEADTIFNSAYHWDSYRGPLNGSQDFHRVALHEFGHVVGLAHPDGANPPQHVTAIMNSTISNIDTLQADDINGAKSIYDSGPAFLSANPAPNLVNLSTRAFVGLGENAVIGGF